MDGLRKWEVGELDGWEGRGMNGKGWKGMKKNFVNQTITISVFIRPLPPSNQITTPTLQSKRIEKMTGLNYLFRDGEELINKWKEVAKQSPQRERTSWKIFNIFVGGKTFRDGYFYVHMPRSVLFAYDF